uniref:Protein ABIL3 n=1 Tax=Anthurium amnicola TaxID=1678845 RepID=A0A1D1Y643_9ARAE
MQTLSPSSASLPTCQDACPTYDELSMQQSLLFSDILKDLKNLRSQLYSAAEYFELSYTNDDHKQTVVDTLKDYAVKALVNTVDHLGSVSYKVNDLLDEKFDDVSGTELRVSCIEQRLRTCQGFIDHEGFSQQSLVMTTPKYHKRWQIHAWVWKTSCTTSSKGKPAEGGERITTTSSCPLCNN